MRRARDWVASKFTIPATKRVSLFETTIRIVGGFLAAYDLSQDTLFLDKARDIVDRMLPYFEASTTGQMLPIFLACLYVSIFVVSSLYAVFILSFVECPFGIGTWRFEG